MQLFWFGTDFLAFLIKKKNFPPTEGLLFSSNSKDVLQGMVARLGLGLVEITQPFGRDRRHTTIRTERDVSQNYSKFSQMNSTVIYGTVISSDSRNKHVIC